MILYLGIVRRRSWEENQCNLVVNEAAKPGDTHMSDMQDVFVNFTTQK